ncbi:MAG: alpha/beta fold hydrolase [Sphingomonadaceae bacterium]
MTRKLQAETPSLLISYEEHGPDNGQAVVLLHGFPYDPRAYDVVAPALAAEGLRVIVPYLRGYGPTRFIDDAIPRSGEQAALGNDLIELIEALDLQKPVLAGYDWGGRAACITAAVRPDLAGGLVSVCGYNLFGPPLLGPADPAMEHLLWYQYYLHMHRGRMMLTDNRRAFCRYLWQTWSPTWDFDDATFAASASSFDNPDFVEVVLHSYRHRSGLVPGDPRLTGLAARLETRPDISVPTIVLHGDKDHAPLSLSLDRSRFTGSYQRKIIAGAGHNLPQETPEPMVEAVLELANSLR